MRSRRPGGARLVGLLVTVAAAAFAVVVFLPFSLPWNRGLHLQVQAGAYGELNTGAWVELNGARVGSVDSVESRSGFSLIRLSIEPRFAGLLHADTTATIRPHGLLGPKFVSLQGGTTGQLGDGASIPLSRTTVSTDLDQVLNSLQPDVRANLKTIFVELGRAADGRGASMNGAGSMETNYIIDGVQVNDPAYGTQGTTLLQDFIQEVDVKTGGYQAEYGRSTGGIVNVVTKSGGNEFHGSVFANWSPLEANRKPIGNLGEAIRNQVSQRYNLDFGAEVGGPILKDKLWFFAGFAPQLVGVNPALPCLMQAVLETKSAFGGSDGNGHYVRVQVVATSGNAPLPNCGGSPTSQTPPLHDQDLVALFLGH